MTAIVVLVILVALLALGMGALKRRGRREATLTATATARIDPFTVGEPWRRHVSSALSTQRRYDEIVKGVDAGPTRDRMTTIGNQLQRGVGELFAIARRGDELDATIGRIDSASLNRQLATATDDAGGAALQSQLDAAGRLKATRDATDQQLRTMNLRLGQLVAQAAEVSVGGGATTQLGSQLDDLVGQMEALRLAVADVEAVRHGTTLPPELTLPTETSAPATQPPTDEPGSAAPAT
ncbi:MAG: hypothetical protein QM733_15505 [Ilumatobacteraceae bacterium]